MSIIINLDVMMAKRKKGLTELAGEVDITLANLSILKNNKAKAVRLSTLNAICKVSPEISFSMWRMRKKTVGATACRRYISWIMAEWIR